jgi:hypothetical protein
MSNMTSQKISQIIVLPFFPYCFSGRLIKSSYQQPEIYFSVNSERLLIYNLLLTTGRSMQSDLYLYRPVKPLTLSITQKEFKHVG